MRGHHADPESCDRPAAGSAERLFCDGRDCAGVGAPGPAAADGGGGQYRRGCGARAKGRSLASAGDRADRHHDHRGPPRQLWRGDARRGSAGLSRRVSRLSRPLRARDQYGDRRARAFLFLADPGRVGAEARRDDPEEEIRRHIRDSAYSRFPVVQGGTHQLAGIVQVKDLLAAAFDGQPFNLRAALRPPLFLPNTVTVLRALEVFKTSSEPMALVVDEYGDLEGLVTLTDILEALVGELPDAGETDPRIVKREDGTWLIDGMVGLDELKQVLGVSQLPGEDPDFHSVGGYLMARLNRVPMVADRVTAGDWRFEIVEMDGRRVDRVLVAPVKMQSRLG